MHAVRGLIEPGVFGFREEDLADLPPDAYLSLVLEFYYGTMLRIARTDTRSLLVPYEADMTSAVETIARFAGFELTAAHREKMRTRAGCHAKEPRHAFAEPDSCAVETSAACQASYEALEGFRRSHPDFSLGIPGPR